jgi:hypothetical protein
MMARTSMRPILTRMVGAGAGVVVGSVSFDAVGIEDPAEAWATIFTTTGLGRVG